MTVDAASEAIAYERGYEGPILEPEDVDTAVHGLAGAIRRSPAAALAIASSGLSPASSLLRETDYEGPLLAAASAETRAAMRTAPEVASSLTMPLGFYGL